MRRERHPVRQCDGGKRPARQVLRVKDHVVRPVLVELVDVQHQVALAFRAVLAPGDEDRLGQMAAWRQINLLGACAGVQVVANDAGEALVDLA